MKPIESRTDVVRDALTYVRKFAGHTVLIKLGGAALQDAKLVVSICEDLALIRSVGISTILVHGGGPAINEELAIHGIEWEFIQGQRKTTPEMMKLIEMVLCGSVNRRIVRTLNQAGVKAVGISGTDAGFVKCTRMSEELGRVGKVESVDAGFLRTVLNTQNEAGMGFIPVIAPVGFGENGEPYNINADWAAARIAESLGLKKIIYLTDQDGILGRDGKVLSELSAEELEGLIQEEVVKGGMLAKTQTVLHALRHGVNAVHILNSKRPFCLIDELFTAQGVGTLCKLKKKSPVP